MEPLSNEDIKTAIQLAISDKERGFPFLVTIDDEALDFIVTATNGDLRSAYNSLDLAVMSTSPNEDGSRHISLETMENSLQRSYITMDKTGTGIMMFYLPYKNPLEVLMSMLACTTPLV
ncbi:Chromosome segregation helicase [Streptococcus pyogenes]|nr:Chromosome segregation helicase [Streptococcus pyogenes]